MDTNAHVTSDTCRNQRANFRISSLLPWYVSEIELKMSDLHGSEVVCPLLHR